MFLNERIKRIEDAESINLQEQGLLPTNQIQLPISNTNNLYQLNSIKPDIIEITSNNHYLSNTINHPSIFINDVLIYDDITDKESIDITRDTVCF